MRERRRTNPLSGRTRKSPNPVGLGRGERKPPILHSNRGAEPVNNKYLIRQIVSLALEVPKTAITGRLKRRFGSEKG